jgi:hypothetical protein
MARMSKAIAILGACVVIGVIPAASASADPGVGQPLNPSCFGQQVSGFAEQFGGVHNAAIAFGVTIQQGHNLVRGLCGRSSGFTPIP